MRKSENFDLNLYEGTDIFNPLTNEVPNYEKIDAQMKKNYNLSVGKATELKTGTVHALTRENADCPMIHFTATSNFTSNDTFTVDGVQVSALLVDGSTLPTNCYIIGSEVICYLKGTLLTFFLSGSISKDSEKLGGELPNYYAKQEGFERLETTVTSMGGIVEKNSNDIIKINNSLDKKVSSPTSINLLANWDNNTNTTITLLDNISNYSFIIIGLRNNSSNIVFNSTTIPSDVFKNVVFTQGCRAYIGGNDVQATAQCLSDNSIKAGGNALSSSYNGVIFGVK